MQELTAIVALIETATRTLETEIAHAKALNDHPATIRWSYIDDTIQDNYCFISWGPADGVGGNSATENFASMRAQQGGSSSDSWKDDMLSEINPGAARRLARGEIAPRDGQVELAPGDWGYESESVLKVPALGPATAIGA